MNNQHVVLAPLGIQSQDIDEQEVIATYHNAGHFCINRVRRDILNAGYDIKNLRRKLAEFSASCAECISNKSYSSTAKQSSLPTAPEVKPFEFVAVDIVGPLPQRGPHRYLLTMTDHATKWLEAVPLARIDASTVAKAFSNNWVMKFGAPRIFHSDKGTQFESNVFAELLKKYNIKKSRTTPYWPAGNGVIERAHRTLKDRLRCSSKPWPQELSEAVFNINRSVHASTNCSPFFALFRREACLPADWPTLPKMHLSTKQVIKMRTPRMAALKIHNPANCLAPRFSKPITVKERINAQLLRLVNNRVVNVRNCKLVY